MQRVLGVSLLRSSFAGLQLSRGVLNGASAGMGVMLVRGMANVGLDSLAPAKGSTHQVCRYVSRTCTKVFDA